MCQLLKMCLFHGTILYFQKSHPHKYYDQECYSLEHFKMRLVRF